MRGQYVHDEYEAPYQDGTVTMRRCTHCGEYKPLLTDFHKNGPGAYRDECKTCYNIKRRENRTKKRHSDFKGSQKRRGEEDFDYTHQEWKEAVIFFQGECAYCGATPRKGQRLTRDHLDAFSKGGQTKADNIIPACSSCNSSKGDQEWRGWYMKQPFFSQERMNRIFKWRTIMKMVGGCDES